MLTTVVLQADVPDSLSGASVQAAAVAFAQSFESDVDGAAIIACTVDGASVLPSAADEYQAAREALDALSAGTGSIKAADLKAAVARLDRAARAFETSMASAPAPAPVPAPPAPAAIVDAPDLPGAVHPDAAATLAATVTANEVSDLPPVPPVAPAPSPADAPADAPTA